VEIIYDVISSVVYMACVETYAQTVIVFNSVDDVCKLFKSPSHFRSFARHRFQGNLYILFGGKNFIQPIDDGLDSTVRPCPDMASRVQDDLLRATLFRAVDFFLEEFNSVFKFALTFGVRYIDDVRSMHDDV